MMPQSEIPAREPSAEETPRFRWYHKAFALAFVVFCLEIGIVLMVLPWTEYWDNNFFATLVPPEWSPGWQRYWDNPYVRGAVSGLGIVNVMISFSELFRLRRFRG
jgi:hypothetical protein